MPVRYQHKITNVNVNVHVYSLDIPMNSVGRIQLLRALLQLEPIIAI